jgi:heptaprenylglyceryl phosphate synthase
MEDKNPFKDNIYVSGTTEIDKDLTQKLITKIKTVGEHNSKFKIFPIKIQK